LVVTGLSLEVARLSVGFPWNCALEPDVAELKSPAILKFY